MNFAALSLQFEHLLQQRILTFIWVSDSLFTGGGIEYFFQVPELGQCLGVFAEGAVDQLQLCLTGLLQVVLIDAKTHQGEDVAQKVVASPGVQVVDIERRSGVEACKLDCLLTGQGEQHGREAAGALIIGETSKGLEFILQPRVADRGLDGRFSGVRYLIKDTPKEINPQCLMVSCHVKDGLCIYRPIQIRLNALEKNEVVFGTAFPEEKIILRTIEPLDQSLLNAGMGPQGQFRGRARHLVDVEPLRLDMSELAGIKFLQQITDAARGDFTGIEPSFLPNQYIGRTEFRLLFHHETTSHVVTFLQYDLV